jgi:large subunit ribosomal protein L5
VSPAKRPPAGGSRGGGASKSGPDRRGGAPGRGQAQQGRSGAQSRTAPPRRGAGGAGGAPERRQSPSSGNGAIAYDGPRLKQRYAAELRDRLKQQLGCANVMQVPRLEKIVLNAGVGRATQQQSLLEGAVRDLETITGQRPVITRARRSVAGFKVREGNAIGAMVTLRGDRMWEFFDRLISLAIPRIRDFRGMSPRSFDGRGNYTFGVTEQLIFPEIDYDRIDTTRGFDVTIVTTARTDAEGRALLDAFGFPFRREGQQA